MNPDRSNQALVDDELDVLAALVPVAGRDIVELGCGAAKLARALLDRHPDTRVTGLEVDERQHAKNLATPQPGLQFVAAGAQSIPVADASFDAALMLKSLHHVPMPLLASALTEVARVLRPRGHLYVSEPVYDGPLNDVVRLFNARRRGQGGSAGGRRCGVEERCLGAGGRAVLRDAGEIQGLRGLRAAHDAADLCRPSDRRRQVGGGECRLRVPHED